MEQSLAVRCLIVKLPPTGCFKREIMQVKMRHKIPADDKHNSIKCNTVAGRRIT